MANVDARLLKGLKFRSADEKVVEEDGRKIKKFIQTERPLTAKDVISSKDCGDSIVIVTADGQKLTIEKAEEKGGK